MTRLSGFFFQICDIFIESFDIFGISPHFRVLKRNKFTSSIGFVGTLILGSVIFAYFASEITQMIEKTTPSTVSSEMQVLETSEFELNNDNFTLAITVTDSLSNPIKGQGKYYNITFNQCDRIRNVNPENGTVTVTLTCQNIPSENCNSSHFTTDLQIQQFSNVRFGVVQCINRKYLNNNPPILQGLLAGNVYRYIKVQLEICQNSTNYNECAPIEEIQTKLKAGKYAVYSSDYLMQLTDHNNPFEQIIRLQFSTFSSSSSKTIVQRYTIFETITDDGLLWENQQITQNLQQSSWQESSDLYNNEFFVSHYINIDYKQSKQLRSYIKIQTILSKIGGIWNVLVFFSSLILNPLIMKFMYIQLAHEIYELEINDNITNLQNNFIDQQQISKQNKNNISGKNYVKTQLKKLFSLFYCPTKNKQQVQKAVLKIQKQMDMIYMLEKLKEIDLMKTILFNKEQQQLFDSLPKPKIQLEQNENLINHQQNTPIDEQNSSSVQQRKSSDVDTRLIRLINERLQNQNKIMNLQGSAQNQIASVSERNSIEMMFIPDSIIQEPPPQQIK